MPPRWMAAGNNVSNLQTCEITDAQQWDNALVSFGAVAHPSQAWAWGEAKKSLGDNIERWMVLDGESPVLMAQVFVKRVSPMRIKTGWVPRGPVMCDSALGDSALKLWKKTMARRGFRAAIMQPYRPLTQPKKLGIPLPLHREHTFIVDLSGPMDALEKEFRYGKNRFKRDGGTVVEDSSPSTVQTLADLLGELSKRKGFSQYGDQELLHALIAQFSQSTHPQVSAKLYRASIGEKIGGCALILRVGDIAHYSWGAFDYELRNSRVNEALQWDIVEKLRASGVQIYDLEGADLKRNPGVYHFKRRMGGRLVEHSPYQFSFLI